MNTEIFNVKNPGTEGYSRAISRGAELLRAGELVAFPTETVYGLGGNGLDGAACRKIYEAKGRPSDNPLILHVADFEGLKKIVSRVTETAEKIFAAFMPGPITVILPRSACVPDAVTGGLDTVAVRMPDQPVARDLILAAGLPVAAPSANISGRPSPTNGETVSRDLSGRIGAIMDGGSTDWGIESTIVDCTEADGADTVTILRPGAVTAEMLGEIIGTVKQAAPTSAAETESGLKRAPMAPGMKYTHYAPKSPLTLAADKETLLKEYQRRRSEGEQVGLLLFAEDYPDCEAEYKCSLGSRANLREIAAGLYDRLRYFDELPVDSLLCPIVPREGLGVAIMNRLGKASGGRMI
ncbi:MAG: L-threonylcarbamoyladenylate synthase [Selenomonadaceae bacterium]|nr:L-threonylcarbamoyladenylate synthase [Selenomonadaceae bacterium]